MIHRTKMTVFGYKVYPLVHQADMVGHSIHSSHHPSKPGIQITRHIEYDNQQHNVYKAFLYALDNVHFVCTPNRLHID